MGFAMRSGYAARSAEEARHTTGQTQLGFITIYGCVSMSPATAGGGRFGGA